MRETFATRVQALHDSWAERRHVARLAGAHDLASQFRLLSTLHSWSEGAVADIASIYGDSLTLTLTRAPEQDDPAPAFSLTIAGQYTLTFALDERRRATGPSWHVSVSVRSPGTHAAANAGPERRNGQWTRARLEEVLLTVLGAYERSLVSPEEDFAQAMDGEAGAAN